MKLDKASAGHDKCAKCSHVSQDEVLTAKDYDNDSGPNFNFLVSHHVNINNAKVNKLFTTWIVIKCQTLW